MKDYKKKKEELIFLKEINSLLINVKETEKEYFIRETKSTDNKKEVDGKNNFIEDKKALDKKMKSLKYILKNLEKNY